MDSITIRSQDETLASIENEAERRNLSKSEVIRKWFADRDDILAEGYYLYRY